jgi:hypothetical protein
MNLAYWVRQRTEIIRLFYDKGRVPFEQLKRDIDEAVKPWEPPPFNPDTDSPEPAFLEEWLQAEQTRELVGMLAVSLLADTLGVYFADLEREIRIVLTPADRKSVFKDGKVEGYRQIFEHVMGDKFADCPVHFDVIEQVILARNDFAHGDNILSFQTDHNKKTLEKHPNPFFVADQTEQEDNAWRLLTIEVSREKLMAAIDEVEQLADWVQNNEDAIWEWRARTPVAT